MSDALDSAAPDRSRLIHAAAHDLGEAKRLRRPIPRLSLSIRHLSEMEAYRIASLTALASGSRPVGYKLGYTSSAMRAQMRISEPNYGVLFGENGVASGDHLPFECLIHPLVEPEFALRMRVDLTGPGISEDEAWQAVDGIMPALEIVDTRYESYDFDAVDNIADNSSAARFVLGPVTRRGDAPDLRAVRARLQRNGAELATGFGRYVLGSPAAALAWLANKLGSIGGRLKTGEIVLTGGITRAYPARAGDRFSALFDELGSVAVHF